VAQFSSFDNNMIIFDVDGTLLGGESANWASFGAAFEEAVGFAPAPAYFETLEEVTAQAIVHQALNNHSIEEKKAVERAVRCGHLKRLSEAYKSDPLTFSPTTGSVSLLQDLKLKKIPVAIATGDWFETVTFKLTAARIAFKDLPMATSSDRYRRADIIALAAMKAGASLGGAIYVGDGTWDFRASQKLGIPFIGVGSNAEKLRQAGAKHILPDLAPENFWHEVEEIRRPNPSLGNHLSGQHALDS
jgi:phosphoglycolate phosphatase-like HAD superfamily hydrolase